jgi:MFS family permease
VSAYFLVLGLTAGVWMARIPAVKAQAHLSDGTLGVALFAVPVGLVFGAVLAERLVDRLGSAPVARACGVGGCLLSVTPGLARNLAGLMAALLAVGIAAGTLDVAQNAQGVRVEAAYGRPVMTSMHAFFSLGAIAGALVGGGFAWAGVGPLPSLAAAGLAGAIIDACAGPWLLPETAPVPGAPQTAAAPGAPQTPPGAQRTPPDAPRTPPGSPPEQIQWGRGPQPREERGGGPQPQGRQVRRLIVALGVLAVCGLAAEGAAGDWSAVYLRDNLGTSAGVAALGFAAFSVTMTVGRAVGDRLIRRFGVVSLIRACGLIAAVGLAGGLAASNPAAAVAGFAVFGAGLSVVVPQVFAAGGRADSARPGSGLAKVVGLGYAGQSAGPAVIGAVASLVGLRLALAIPVLLALWIAVAAPVLRAPDGTAYGRHMDDKEIMGRISELIQTEHELRDQLASGRLSSEQERERLRSAEEALDQCWDLLRQRRARREFGENPDSAAVRPVAEVEGYQQ